MRKILAAFILYFLSLACLAQDNATLKCMGNLHNQTRKGGGVVNGG